MSADPGRSDLRAAGGMAAALVWRAAPVLIVGNLVLTLGEAAAPILAAWLTKAVIDGLVAPGAATGVIAPTIALAAVGVAVAILPRTTTYLGAELGRAVGVSATNRLFAATEQFTGLVRFEDPRFLDRLRLAQQGANACTGITTGVVGAGRSCLTVVGFVGSLLVLSPTMTAVVVVAALPVLLAQLRLSRHRAKMVWQIGHTERRELFYTRLLASVDAAKEVRLFGIGGFLRARMLADRRTANAARHRMDRRELVLDGGLGVFGALIAGAGLVWAVLAARRGELSVGDVSMFVAAVAGVRGALDSLVYAIAGAHHNLLLFGHYVAVVRAGPDLRVTATRRLPALRRGIELRDVWFRYSDQHPWLLRGVNLVIPYGRTTALVGLNGAGKSTLVKLLCRFYDPTRGAILWDGVDLREVAPAELRDRISAVFQDHMNYDLSAAENIALGELSALGDRERIGAAAATAGIHELIQALPNGYDTLLTRMFFGGEVGDDEPDPAAGVVLSGGQWQRVALARALLRDQRDLMILDEPSSGLDPQAEGEIHARVREHRRGRTSLLISHRLNTVRDADAIAVLGSGVVVELGSHVELLAAGGAYARLFRLQSAGYRDEPAPQELAL